MNCIEKYFKDLSEKQREQYNNLYDLYKDWNSKINVISRKDIDNLYEKHVLHSLGIAKAIKFKDGSYIMDMGTGGGFPGIPLAIMFPEVHFHLVDSINKKLTVVKNIAEEIGLKNVSTRHCRVEEEKGLFDFVVSRAVSELPTIVRLCKKNISKEQKNALPNGLICLKGGDINNEIKPFKNVSTIINLSEFFEEEFFDTKKIIHVPC